MQDEVGTLKEQIAALRQQMRSNVGGGAELNPQDIRFECLELFGQLFSALAPFGQRSDILARELAANDVMQLLGDVIKVEGRDVWVTTRGVSVATERLDLGKVL